MRGKYNQMNYLKIHNSIIEKARNRTLKGYSEKHHIIPKCLGGSNSKENLVRLTPEEHYVVHQLLVKIYPNNRKLIYAVKQMTVKCKNNKRNNKLYGWIRREFAKEVSKRMIGRNNPMYGKTGKEHPMYGKTGKLSPFFGRPRAISAKNKISKSLSGKNHPLFGKPAINRKKIICLNNGIIYDSISLAAKALNVCQPNISKVLSGKLHHTGNYKFEYIKEYINV